MIFKNIKQIYFAGKLLILLFFFFSCTSYLNVNFIKEYSPLADDAEVVVLSLSEKIPDGAEYLGEIKMENLRSGKDCDEETFYEEAKIEARKIGGDALKVTFYEAAYSRKGCPNIVVTVLKLAR